MGLVADGCSSALDASGEDRIFLGVSYFQGSWCQRFGAISRWEDRRDIPVEGGGGGPCLCANVVCGLLNPALNDGCSPPLHQRHFESFQQKPKTETAEGQFEINALARTAPLLLRDASALLADGLMMRSSGRACARTCVQTVRAGQRKSCSSGINLTSSVREIDPLFS